MSAPAASGPEFVPSSPELRSGTPGVGTHEAVTVATPPFPSGEVTPGFEPCPPQNVDVCPACLDPVGGRPGHGMPLACMRAFIPCLVPCSFPCSRAAHAVRSTVGSSCRSFSPSVGRRLCLNSVVLRRCFCLGSCLSLRPCRMLLPWMVDVFLRPKPCWCRRSVRRALPCRPTGLCIFGGCWGDALHRTAMSPPPLRKRCCKSSSASVLLLTCLCWLIVGVRALSPRHRWSRCSPLR